jgi:hypothetical protein
MKLLMEQIESIVDREGLEEVLIAIIHICDEKAEHVAVNWQDTTTAKWWTNAAEQIQRAERSVSKGPE